MTDNLFMNGDQFLLSFRFTFKAYMRKVQEKAINCCLKTEILLDADGHVLT